jgi:hypothetical protein
LKLPQKVEKKPGFLGYFSDEITETLENQAAYMPIGSYLELLARI